MDSHHKMTDYEALKQAGHSAAKAVEIILDAKRGDLFAQQWIEITQKEGEAFKAFHARR
jgi:hypothetical protein